MKNTNGKISYTNIFDKMANDANFKEKSFTYVNQTTEKGVTIKAPKTVICYRNSLNTIVWCAKKGDNEKSVTMETLKTLANLFDNLSSLPKETKESLKGYVDDSLRKVYESLLKAEKADRKEKAFQSSGIIFTHNGDEKACCPKTCTYKGRDFIVFKGLNKESICAIMKDGDKYTTVVTTLVAEKNNGKRKGYEMNKSHTKATELIDVQIMNNYFNGKSWKQIVALCSKVVKFTSISCPISLKEYVDTTLKEEEKAEKATAEKAEKATAEK